MTQSGKNLIERLSVHAAERPEHCALVCGPRVLTYRALLERVIGLAGALQQQGIGAHNTVGISLADEIDHLLLTLALFGVGGGQIVLATHDSQGVRSDLATRTGVDLIIAEDPRFALPTATFLPWPRVANTTAHRKTPCGEGSLFLPTSGTTGCTNIIPFSESQLCLQAQRHASHRAARYLRPASVEHNNAKRHRLYCNWAGGTNVFRDPGEPDLRRCVETHRVNCLHIAPIHVAGLAAGAGAPLATEVRLSGSPASLALRQRVMEQVSPELTVSYGATECGSVTMAGPLQHELRESCGSPLSGVTVEVVDGLGQACTAGVSGEVRVKAPGMATRYHDNPEASAARFRDGWFHTGDLGFFTDDGELVIEGRKDEMLILNGINISPLQIERVLEEHPAVNAAAAFAMPSSIHGDIPVAAVELVPGCSSTKVELLAFARQALGLRSPRRLLVLPELPRNAPGKILKQKILEVALGERRQP